jgi:primosomal protein N' (replication factor Y)
MKLGEWISSYYFCPIGLVLDSFVPPSVKKGTFKAVYDTVIHVNASIFKKETEKINPAFKRRLSIARCLSKHSRILKNDLQICPPVSLKDLLWFEKCGLITLEKIQINRFEKYLNTQSNFSDARPEISIPILTDFQEKAVDGICRALDNSNNDDNNKSTTFLLHGVTGSGKTEVYLRCVERALEQGKKSIILVPEISLTPQMISRFTQRLGNKVAILHSRLSEGERFDEWQRIKNNQAPVVLGARSAVFAPLDFPKLIILDEEHEFTYKQNSAPLYHAAETARKRISYSKGVLVLGSATPRLESYQNAQKNIYQLLKLPRRINKKPPPPVEIVDMRKEFAHKNFSLFSKKLQKEIRNTINRGMKIIILLNRRGHSSFVFCRECGESIKCPDCSVSLKYHQDMPRLKCHYCDKETELPRICPSCGSRYIKYFGAGTQKAFTEFKRLFPDCPCFRMDSDTTGAKGSHNTILEKFKACFPAALIGTQMIAKGLDIHKVTLVGILSADQIINLPDFRARERAFQLITQVAGRAGRGIDQGKVIVQAYDCSDPVLKFACNHDYINFYKSEIEERRLFRYPPHTHMARVIFSGEDGDMVKNRALDFLSGLIKICEKENITTCPFNKSSNSTDDNHSSSTGRPEIIYIPPAPCPIEIIRRKYRWQTLIMCLNSATLQKVLLIENKTSKNHAKIKKIIDIDTSNTM